jgi:mono/diheme cytochrome c family protein
MLIGAGSLAAALLVLILLIAVSGIYDVAADAPHTAIVRNLIGFARERSIDSRAEDIKAPSLADKDMIADGASHYSEMCTGCHLGPGMKENEMRPGMNPKPPVLADFPPENPGEQFWIVKHGIKMTGMPAWGATHSDKEIWEIVAFVQKLHGMSPGQYHALIKAAPHPEDMDMDMGH